MDGQESITGDKAVKIRRVWTQNGIVDCDHEREKDDFYTTPPTATEGLLEKEQFCHRIWECACGVGHISKILEKHGYEVRSTDLIDRGYGQGGIDFLQCRELWDGDIITNPPFKLSNDFILHALSLIPDGRRVAMFHRLTFLEGSRRYKQIFLKFPPKYVYCTVRRLSCYMSGDKPVSDNTNITFAWFIWEKGFTGEPTLRWFNTEKNPNKTEKLQ